MRIHTTAAIALLATLAASTSSRAQLGWRPHDDLSDRADLAPVFDPIRKRLVLFGGTRVVYNWSKQIGGTWEWDGRSWTAMHPSTSPSPRAASMAWDPVSKRVILFGGGNRAVSFNAFRDTWAWDGQDWKRLNPKTVPGQRVGQAMATDYSRGRIVMYGGFARLPTGWTNAMPLNDTWEWTGTDWVQVKTLVTPPSGGGFGFAYDPIAKRMLLNGGGDGIRPYPSVTWSFDGKTWKKANPKTEPPRAGYTMATDLTSGKIYWYSRLMGSPDVFFVWSGGNWVKLTPAKMPPARMVPRLATDPLSGRVLIVGGLLLDQKNARDLWLFDGTAWQRREGSTLPYLANAMAAAYDTDRDRMLVVGSPNNADPQKPSRIETWSYRDGRFTRIKTKTAPFERQKATLTYHAASKSFVLFGGFGYKWPPTTPYALDETWIFDGTDWREHKASPRPPVGACAPMAYDSRRKVTVLHYGGTGPRGSTWEWNGKAWSERRVTGIPRDLACLKLVYDPLRGRTITYDHRKTPPSTYEYDGKSWKKVQPLAYPSPTRLSGIVVSAPFLGGVLLCGGWNYGPNRETMPRGDSWLYDGKTWRKISVSSEPPTRVPSSWPWIGVSDPDRQRILMLYGFLPRNYISSPIWELSERSLTTNLHHPRPGQSFTLSANLPSQANMPLVFGLAANGFPGVPLDALAGGAGKRLPLAFDWLLDSSLRSGAVIALDAKGKGSLTVPVPNLAALEGFDFVAGGLTFQNGGVGTTTNPLYFQIAK